MAGNRGASRGAIVKVRVDLSGMDAGLARAIGGVSQLSEARKAEFARRYDALGRAGAEWVEVVAGKDVLSAVLTEDMRSLCAEFGIVV